MALFAYSISLLICCRRVLLIAESGVQDSPDVLVAPPAPCHVGVRVLEAPLLSACTPGLFTPFCHVPTSSSSGVWFNLCCIFIDTPLILKSVFFYFVYLFI